MGISKGTKWESRRERSGNLEGEKVGVLKKGVSWERGGNLYKSVKGKKWERTGTKREFALFLPIFCEFIPTADCMN